MDNAEKLQEVSAQTNDETPEVVQKNTELMEEKHEEEKVEEVEKPTLEEHPNEEITSEEVAVEASATEKEEEVLPALEDADGKSDDAVADESDAVEEVVEKPAAVEQVEEQPTVANEKEKDSDEEDVEVEDEHEEDEHEEELDFDHASKDEILTKIRDVRNEDDIRLLDRVLKAVKPRFDELYEVSKNEALQKFVSEGNEADSFEYHGDELDKEFFTLFKQLRSKRNKHYKDLQNQRDDNLKKKEQLLEQLRQIVDGEESVNSINSVRELQNEWKKVGPVPGTQNKTLWANYNALLDRYYDNRSIYFELKDLDRKKNLQLKSDLCEKAEALNELEDMKSAIVLLNELHEEYKHIGPVPQDDQEALWQRFKAASDAVYSKRKEYFEGLKVEFDANLVKKEELIKEVEVFTAFESDRITDWNAKTKELLEVQKRWEAIGGVPKEKAKTVNKSFWNGFKAFFANKNQFFKELESKRGENLEKKQELIRVADELKDSSDWDSAAQKLKNLQAEWKDIGPVPEKVRNETYAKFKAACDHFFNKRREQNKEKFKAYDENLALKLQVCDQLEAAGSAAEINLDDVYDLIDNYTSLGFVPKNAIKKINRRFDEVVGKLLSNETIDADDRMDLKNHIQVGRIRNTPGGDRKIQRKEHSIKRKISSLENDISTWNTNIEFFATSATADKLKAEMQERIEAARKELDDLKSQLASIS